MSSLPVMEVVEMVIDHLYSDKSSLASCSTVAKSWAPRSRHHLFHTIKLIVISEENTFEEAATFFSSSQSVSGHVRHLHIRATAAMWASGEELDVPPGIFFPMVLPHIPNVGVNAHRFFSLVHSMDNLSYLDLEGVYPELDVPRHAHPLPEFRTPSIRRLAVRDSHFPEASLFFFFQLATILPNLEELSLLSSMLQRPRAIEQEYWSGDFPISRLMIREVSGIIGTLPVTSFRNVKSLDIPAILLLVPEARPYLEAVAPCLVELTLVVWEFGLFSQLPQTTFQLSSCPELRSLCLKQPEPSNHPQYFASSVNAMLQLAPLSLQNLSISFERTSMYIYMVEGWDWDQTQRILSRFPILETITMLIKTSPESVGYDELSDQDWEEAIRGRFSDRFQRALQFHSQ